MNNEVIMKDKKQEVKELLEYQLGDITNGIEVHKKYNQPYDPLGDSFTEMLHWCMYDTLYRCGSGWDTLIKVKVNFLIIYNQGIVEVVKLMMKKRTMEI